MKLFKEIVVAFVITKGPDSYVYSAPLTADAEGFDYVLLSNMNRRLDDDDVYLGVVPAPAGSFAVSAYSEDHPRYLFLGYEYHGADHPDWGDAFERALASELRRETREGIYAK